MPLSFPKLMQSIRNIFNSHCTIKHRTEVKDPITAEMIYTYITDPVLTAILCYKEDSSQVQLQRGSTVTILNNPYNTVLSGYYPGILVGDQAVINDVTYNIVGVVHDDTHTVTFMQCEVLKPNGN